MKDKLFKIDLWQYPWDIQSEINHFLKENFANDRYTEIDNIIIFKHKLDYNFCKLIFGSYQEPYSIYLSIKPATSISYIELNLTIDSLIKSI